MEIMKLPKMLPWLARRAGVSDERAAELWAEAIRHATIKTGWVGTPEYWRVAVDRVVELLDAEAKALNARGFSRLARAQVQLWLLPLLTAQALGLIASRAWLRLTSCRQPA